MNDKFTSILINLPDESIETPEGRILAFADVVYDSQFKFNNIAVFENEDKLGLGFITYSKPLNAESLSVKSLNTFTIVDKELQIIFTYEIITAYLKMKNK
jgi:hypothetical protein